MKHVSRRAFVKTLGSSLAALPLARLLWGGEAQAAGARRLRLVILMSPHGTLTQHWRPRMTADGHTLDYEGSMLAPLEPLKHKLIVLDGIDYRVLYDKGLTGHDGGQCTFLTGTRAQQRDGSLYPSGASVDQVIASQVGSATPHRSLELGVYRDGGTSVASSMVYGQGGARIPSEIDPAAVYRRLFNAASAGADAGAVERRLAQRRSVLDYVRADLQRFESQVGSDEREKLQAHLEALRSIENRLTLESDALASCEPPVTPSSVAHRSVQNIPRVVDLQFDLITQALACDLTRVVTFHFLQGGDPTPMPWLGIETNIHDNIAHRSGDGGAADQQLVRIQRWYAGKVAELLARLDAVQEGDHTLLDNTIVLWGNELGQPAAHSSINIPMVLAGGAAGAWQPGRWLVFSQSPDPSCHGPFGGCPPEDRYRDQSPHNAVLVSLCRAFGLDVQTFGDPDYVGGLPGLL